MNLKKRHPLDYVYPPNPKMEALYTGRGAFMDEGSMVTYESFFYYISEAVKKTEFERDDNDKLQPLESGLAQCLELFRQTHKDGGRVIFIGNGGSAAIASHMAIDYTKNGEIRAIALNDLAALTCIANDFGYEEVFAKQIHYQATHKDTAVIVSSSGKSPNILRAADMATEIGLSVVTLSGMNPNNRLRKKGNLNFWVPAKDYGIVELSHLILLHSIVSVG